jgi:hypothetical protein
VKHRTIYTPRPSYRKSWPSIIVEAITHRLCPRFSVSPF